jgi:acetyl-CoA acetyltransferase
VRIARWCRTRRCPLSQACWPEAGLTLDDIGLFEITESFAVVAENTSATVSILIGTVLDELERRDLKRGFVTMCGGLHGASHHHRARPTAISSVFATASPATSGRRGLSKAWNQL